jgi:hypothetical protein
LLEAAVLGSRLIEDRPELLCWNAADFSGRDRNMRAAIDLSYTS